MKIVSHIVTICGGLASRAITDEAGQYLGATNQTECGRYEALEPGVALDDEPTFATHREAELYLAARFLERLERKHRGFTVPTAPARPGVARFGHQNDARGARP